MSFTDIEKNKNLFGIFWDLGNINVLLLTFQQYIKRIEINTESITFVSLHF